MAILNGLGISIVVYHSDAAELRAALESLRVALSHACGAGLLDHATVWLIDNGSEDAAELDRLATEALAPDEAWLRLEVIRGHGNVGYGAGHDLALSRTGVAWHLILNPDVRLHADAISEGLRHLRDHPRVALVTPHAVDQAGPAAVSLQALSQPSGPRAARLRPGKPAAPPSGLLDRYEMRDLPEHEVATGIPIASGCFMLARADVLRSLGGFSPRYFLYFEDFDLSLRLSRIAAIAYVPTVRIVHLGGEAARKGLLHQRLFVRSALTFFSSARLEALVTRPLLGPLWSPGPRGSWGATCAAALVARGVAVRGLVRRPDAPLPERVEPAHARGLDDREGIAAALRGVEGVIHLAARVHQPAAPGGEAAFRAINVEGTRTAAGGGARGGCAGLRLRQLGQGGRRAERERHGTRPLPRRRWTPTGDQAGVPRRWSARSGRGAGPHADPPAPAGVWAGHEGERASAVPAGGSAGCPCRSARHETGAACSSPETWSRPCSRLWRVHPGAIPSS